MFRAMAIREIITAPDPRLKQKSKPVEAVTDEIRALMDDMLETMYAAPGIGLAAIQIGVPKRVIVIDLAHEGEEPRPMYFANPEIIEKADDTAPYEEGCLSVPGFYEEVERAEHIRVRFLDRNGEEVEAEMEGLLAVCVQHEMDHLEGKLFVDYISETKRSRIRKRLLRDQRHRSAAVV